MPLLIAAVIVAVAVVSLRLALKRATTLAELAIDNGCVRVVRGGIPIGILQDLSDVVRNPPVGSARVRIFRGARHAQVEIRGDISAAQVQRIRNVVGSVPLARLASTRRA